MKISRVISALSASRSAHTSAAKSPSDRQKTDLRHFVVIFRSEDGRLLRQESYDDADEAETQFLKAERKHHDDSDVQVVMFTARSIENVMNTHPHYFESRDEDSGEDTAEFLIPAH